MLCGQGHQLFKTSLSSKKRRRKIPWSVLRFMNSKLMTRIKPFRKQLTKESISEGKKLPTKVQCRCLETEDVTTTKKEI